MTMALNLSGLPFQNILTQPNLEKQQKDPDRRACYKIQDQYSEKLSKSKVIKNKGSLRNLSQLRGT